MIRSMRQTTTSANSLLISLMPLYEDIIIIYQPPKQTNCNRYRTMVLLRNFSTKLPSYYCAAYYVRGTYYQAIDTHSAIVALAAAAPAIFRGTKNVRTTFNILWDNRPFEQPINNHAELAVRRLRPGAAWCYQAVLVLPLPK